METLMSKKNFDVVVYGATGFTGKLVVEYMLNQYGDDETNLGPWPAEAMKN